MTKAEAIAILKRIQEPEAWEPQINQVAFKALDMAIEALSQESSEDVISRQAALDAMETWDKFGCDPDGKLVRYDDDKHYIPYAHYEDMVHAIKHLPSAQPEVKEIGYAECANAMLKMWMDNVLTDGEYNRIMDKLNTRHDAERRQDDTDRH